MKATMLHSSTDLSLAFGAAMSLTDTSFAFRAVEVYASIAARIMPA